MQGDNGTVPEREHVVIYILQRFPNRHRPRLRMDSEEASGLSFSFGRYSIFDLSKLSTISIYRRNPEYLLLQLTGLRDGDEVIVSDHFVVIRLVQEHRTVVILIQDCHIDTSNALARVAESRQGIQCQAIFGLVLRFWIAKTFHYSHHHLCLGLA